MSTYLYNKLEKIKPGITLFYKSTPGKVIYKNKRWYIHLKGNHKPTPISQFRASTYGRHSKTLLLDDTRW